MENEKKPIFRHNSPLLIQQVVTPVTLHLNAIMKDLCSLTAAEIDGCRAGVCGLKLLWERWRIAAAQTENENKHPQNSDIEFIAVGFYFNISSRLNLNPAEKGQCETF